MKRTKIFVAASTLVLLVAGLVAAKANKKFSVITTVYYKISGTLHTGFTGASANLLTLTTTSPNTQAFFTVSSVQYDLYTSGGSALYIPAL